MENVRVWVAPNGVVLCADQQFSGLMGYPSEFTLWATRVSAVAAFLCVLPTQAVDLLSTMAPKLALAYCQE